MEHYMSTRQPTTSSEERIIYGLLVVIGAIPVGVAIAQHAVLGADATLGLLMIAAGVVGWLIRSWGSRPRRTDQRLLP
jgi:hypothetical protein